MVFGLRFEYCLFHVGRIRGIWCRFGLWLFVSFWWGFVVLLLFFAWMATLIIFGGCFIWCSALNNFLFFLLFFFRLDRLAPRIISFLLFLRLSLLFFRDHLMSLFDCLSHRSCPDNIFLFSINQELLSFSNYINHGWSPSDWFRLFFCVSFLCHCF